MNELEHRALEMLLGGEDQLLDLLRGQVRVASVESRDFTGVGSFTYLSVPESARRAANCARLVLGDVYAEIEGLKHPAGFLLFVNDGAVDCLECFIVDDQWPHAAKLRRAYYVHPAVPESGNLVETKSRDLVWALRDAV